MKFKPKDSAESFSGTILTRLYNQILYEDKNPRKSLELLDFMMERFGFRIIKQTKSGRSFKVVKIVDVEK